MLEEGYLDLAPAEASEISGPKVNESYLQYYGRGIKNQVSKAWAVREQSPEKWIERKERQVEFALPLILNGESCESKMLVDFSGGSGYHTIPYSKHFKLVLHCDLSSSNLAYTSQRAKKLGANNIIFVRMDYFKPPFVGGLERIISFDTLCYGADHERRLLGKIYSALSPDGTAVVDFHNWWHNPVRRLGLLSRNFPDSGSHSRQFVTKLLKESEITSYEYFPFHQEVPNGHPLSSLVSFFIPPTRLTYRIKKT